MKHRQLIPILVLSIGLVLSCSDDPVSPTPVDYASIDTIVYSQHIQPIFDANCISCHAGDNADADLDLELWFGVQENSWHGNAVVPFDTNMSRLTRVLTESYDGTHQLQDGSTIVDMDVVHFLNRWIDEGAKNDLGDVLYEPVGQLAMVCSQDDGSIQAIDAASGNIVRSYDITKWGYSRGDKPHDVVVSDDGNFFFVSLIAANEVIKVTFEGEVVASYNMEIPALMSAKNGLLAISRFMNPDAELYSVVVLEQSTMQPALFTDGGTIDVGTKVNHGIAFTENAQRLFTASLPAGLIHNIDVGTGDVQTFEFAGNAGPVAMTVYGNEMLAVSGQMGNRISMYGLAGENAQLLHTVDVGARPWHPAFLGTTLWVGNNGDNTVNSIDTDGQVEYTVAGNGLSEPHGIATFETLDYVYVSSRNVGGTYEPRIPLYRNGEQVNQFVGTVCQIDATTGLIIKVIEIGDFGSGMTSAWR